MVEIPGTAYNVLQILLAGFMIGCLIAFVSLWICDELMRGGDTTMDKEKRDIVFEALSEYSEKLREDDDPHNNLLADMLDEAAEELEEII